MFIASMQNLLPTPATIIQINTLGQAINIAVGFIIPVAVALVTKTHAPSRTKAIINLAFAAITGVLTAWQVDPTLTWKSALISFGVTFAMSVASYLGLWQHGNINAAIGPKGGTTRDPRTGRFV